MAQHLGIAISWQESSVPFSHPLLALAHLVIWALYSIFSLSSHPPRSVLYIFSFGSFFWFPPVDSSVVLSVSSAVILKPSVCGLCADVPYEFLYSWDRRSWLLSMICSHFSCPSFMYLCESCTD